MTDYELLQHRCREGESKLDAARAWVSEPTRHLRGGVENVDITAGRILLAHIDVLTAERDALTKQLESAREVYHQMLDELNATRKALREWQLGIGDTETEQALARMTHERDALLKAVAHDCAILQDEADDDRRAQGLRRRLG